MGEMDKFLEKHNLLKLYEEETESLNTQVTVGETEAVIKKLLAHKSLDRTVSQENFTKYLRES